MAPIGLYLHIPFCASKCAYCDFYSFAASEETMDAYASALCRELAAWGRLAGGPVDTVYFGGGTPSLLGGGRLARILETADRCFPFVAGAEVTLEANPASAPADGLAQTLRAARAAGVNRLSLGVQSGNPDELAVLGRRHSLSDVRRTVADARAAGIENISLDLMLAVPGQTPESLSASVDFLTGLSPAHISAYLLKIEEGTPFAARRKTFTFPDDDAAADLYLQAVKELGRRGYGQYEISNFARPGFESRHNLKYWNGEPYLGLGPAAHSFFNGCRFYYPRNVKNYISAAGDPGVWKKLGLAPGGPCPPLWEGPGGDPSEYAMLRLRLTAGLDFAAFREKYGRPPHASLFARAEKFLRAGYLTLDDARLAFTPAGFLLSNPILADLLDGEL